MRISDWSSDVCSSDLFGRRTGVPASGPIRKRAASIRRGTLPLPDEMGRTSGNGIPTSLPIPFAGGAARRENASRAGNGRQQRIFGGQIFIDPFSAALAPQARHLHPAKGCGGIGKDADIRSEEHTSELQSLM